jgi:hypothetical protein
MSTTTQSKSLIVINESFSKVTNIDDGKVPRMTRIEIKKLTLLPWVKIDSPLEITAYFNSCVPGLYKVENFLLNDGSYISGYYRLTESGDTVSYTEEQFTQELGRLATC